jgi:beta-glucosidase
VSVPAPNQDPQFPRPFLWGVATAAYQIEGSPLADGAGASIWHRFAHTPDRVHNGDTGDIACDHYRRSAEDVALMGSLGLNSYRFSIAWGRVMPDGRGRVNLAGLGFYERLVDSILAAGIEPMITLYHWDLPAALDDRGGWLNPDVSDWFADYASLLFRRLDDRVPRWVTLNEPWVIADGGYLHGVLAPGHRNRFEAPIATHNLLRAHGAAVQAYRTHGRHAIGLAVNLEPKYPASSTAADEAATARADAYMNRQYLDPVFRGEYPSELRQIFGEAWPEWPRDDFALIRQPIDFLGVNYYTRGVTRADPSAWPVGASTVSVPGAAYTETGWEVCPEALTDVLRWVRDRYGDLALYITENGAAFDDPPAAAGTIHDRLRVEYLRSHLRALRAAIEAGVNVRGYFVWSLLDNLEWAHGYSKRFGLFGVDEKTQERTPKSSAAFYARVISTNGANL